MPGKQKKKSAAEKQKQKQRSQALLDRKRRPVLGECASNYAHALIACHNARPACIPTFPPLPSQKMKCSARGTMTTGTSDFGYVSFDPWQMVAGDAGASWEGYPIFYTQAGWTGTSIVTGGLTTGMNAANSNSHYSRSFFTGANSDLKYRLVAACLRVSYAGDTLSDAGTVVAIATPGLEDLEGKDQADVLKWTNASMLTNRQIKDYVHVAYVPADPDDFEYTGTLPATSSRSCIAFVVDGAANDTPYAWEAHAMFELIGKDARGKTRTSADPNGFAAVLNTANRIKKSAIKKPQERTFFEEISGEVSRLAGEGVDYAKNWLVSSAKDSFLTSLEEFAPFAAAA